MRALFDVNFLVGLLDAEHIHHRTAREWWVSNHSSGWATCPLTQMGVVRVLSQPSYPHPMRVVEALNVLAEATRHRDHIFWPDDVAPVDALTGQPLVGHGQIADAYLLALAAAHHGRLVTFDRRLEKSGMRGIKPENILVLRAAT